MILVYRYRVKSLNGLLNEQSRAVNFVWNYCNNAQKHALKWGKPWLSGFDLNKLTTGSSKELGIHSGTINAVCEQYAKSRSQKKRPYLKYRGKKSLGWVPIKGRDLKREGNAFRFAGNTFRVFKSRDLPEGKIKDGTSFSKDARGNWFLNITIEVEAPERRPMVHGVGIDLGLHNLAAFSTGQKLENPKHLAEFADKLAKAQRANKKKQVQKIHAKIANKRKHYLHDLSHWVVRTFDYIAVGDVSSAKLIKTNMAKATLDAGWAPLRGMIAYKAIRHGAWYETVDERFSSQICSACKSMPASRPIGRADLGIRTWVCCDCGAEHDRDVNAAKNLLSRHGCVSPVVGIPAF